jgi:hypothetical protein
VTASFRKNAAFNVKQRQDYDPQQKARDAGKEARNAKISRSKRQERVAEREAVDALEAVREFSEVRAADIVTNRSVERSLYKRVRFFPIYGPALW